jgi:hypothetical protein
VERWNRGALESWGGGVLESWSGGELAGGVGLCRHAYTRQQQRSTDDNEYDWKTTAEGTVPYSGTNRSF